MAVKKLNWGGFGGWRNKSQMIKGEAGERVSSNFEVLNKQARRREDKEEQQLLNL